MLDFIKTHWADIEVNLLSSVPFLAVDLLILALLPVVLEVFTRVRTKKLRIRALRASAMTISGNVRFLYQTIVGFPAQDKIEHGEAKPGEIKDRFLKSVASILDRATREIADQLPISLSVLDADSSTRLLELQLAYREVADAFDVLDEATGEHSVMDVVRRLERLDSSIAEFFDAEVSLARWFSKISASECDWQLSGSVLSRKVVSATTADLVRAVQVKVSAAEVKAWMPPVRFKIGGYGKARTSVAPREADLDAQRVQILLEEARLIREASQKAGETSSSDGSIGLEEAAQRSRPATENPPG